MGQPHRFLQQVDFFAPVSSTNSLVYLEKAEGVALPRTCATHAPEKYLEGKYVFDFFSGPI